MRRCYLVCYDIRDPKRLRCIHKVLKGYSEAWQYSIFFCILKEIDRVRLQTDLEHQMNQKEDQVMIMDIGSDEKAAREATTVIGKSLPEQESSIVVV